MNLRHGWSASLIDWDRTRNGCSPDERSLRRCNSLSLAGSEGVQRRVRKKSLYLSSTFRIFGAGAPLLNSPEDVL
jgi:hypothetical protein